MLDQLLATLREWIIIGILRELARAESPGPVLLCPHFF